MNTFRKSRSADALCRNKAPECEPQEDVALALRTHDLRVTAARVEVLGLLRASAKPLSHSEVVHALASFGWDRATLYRNLIDLTEAALVRRVALGSTWHFEACVAGRQDASEHPHFVCVACGMVERAPAVELTIAAHEGSPKAIRQGQVQIQLHGRCDTCA